jgi:hypothetical protein
MIVANGQLSHGGRPSRMNLILTLIQKVLLLILSPVCEPLVSHQQSTTCKLGIVVEWLAPQLNQAPRTLPVTNDDRN